MQTSGLIITDRRVAVRYDVRVPIHVYGIGRGRTLNMSSTGIAFEISNQRIPIRDIGFHFALLGSDLLLKCEGRIVRQETSGQRTMIAATIETILIEQEVEASQIFESLAVLAPTPAVGVTPKSVVPSQRSAPRAGVPEMTLLSAGVARLRGE
jgi:hypothetical protein